ncbi:hypothetical protein L1987_02330 [Smallanthus sonchifolius]|uniref:Uncharacterized protein n=1 Tax=Smallanthus sonchifolius TaxID=185202 RepID=A0ACB9K7N8_9ASTR|nr:hypothetical protein L1987_02330 [Smallanthus sonchifolius]
MATSIFVTNFPVNTLGKDLRRVSQGGVDSLSKYFAEVVSGGKGYSNVILDKEVVNKQVHTIQLGEDYLKKYLEDSCWFEGVDVKCIGGKWVILEFSSTLDVCRFRSCESLMIFFKELKDVDNNFVLDKGIVWLEINGLPLCAWMDKSFVHVKIKDVTYLVEIKEFFQWSPSIIRLEGLDVDSLEGSCAGEWEDGLIVDDEEAAQYDNELQMENEVGMEGKFQEGDNSGQRDERGNPEEKKRM